MKPRTKTCGPWWFDFDPHPLYRKKNEKREKKRGIGQKRLTLPPTNMEVQKAQLTRRKVFYKRSVHHVR